MGQKTMKFLLDPFDMLGSTPKMKDTQSGGIEKENKKTKKQRTNLYGTRGGASGEEVQTVGLGGTAPGRNNLFGN